jgi:hypothetical protein
MDDVDRGLRDLRREIDRLTNGGLIIAKDLDMRGYRILNIGNPEDFGDVPSQTQTEEAVADSGTGTGTSGGDVTGPGVSVAGAIAYFDDTSGTSLASGSATITSAGAISATSLALTTALPVTSGGTGRLTSTTAYGLLAAGTTATGAHQTLAAGATTEILVGGGASALPVWTTAQGTGAPVRATSPTLTTPNIGVATGTSLDLSGAMGVAATQSVWFGGLNAGARIRQNLSGNIVASVGGTDRWITTSAAVHPNTNGGLDLGLTGTRWGAGYFSGQVNAATFAASTSASIPKLSNLTTNGFVKTSGGDGTLSVDTTTYSTRPATAKVEITDGNASTFYSTTLVAMLPAARDTYPVTAGRTYRVKVLATISKTSGTSSHALVFGFASPPATWLFGGASTCFIGSSSTGPQHTAIAQSDAGFTTGTQLLAATSGTAAEDYRVQVEGIFTAGASGNIIPAFRWSANPGDGSTNGAGNVVWPTILEVEEIENYGGS